MPVEVEVGVMVLHLQVVKEAAAMAAGEQAVTLEVYLGVQILVVGEVVAT
jgi:hypothetical protein